jgi:tol-pal system protein YbgF
MNPPGRRTGATTSSTQATRVPGRFGAAGTSAAVLLLLTVLALPARAALFPDDEARKSIDALTQRVNVLEGRLTTLEGTVKSQGLVDLLKDVEQLKAEIATLRGQQEVLTYDLEQAQKRQRDLYIDLDARLRKLEGGGANTASAPAGASPPAADAGGAAASSANAGLPGSAACVPPSATDIGAEQRSYDAALDQFKSGSYAAAITSFQAFVRAYPKSPLAPSAMYWAGNAQYAQRDFRAAIATQRQLIATYADSQKVPDALLNIASCQTELGDNAGARRTLDDLVARFPGRVRDHSRGD